MDTEAVLHEYLKKVEQAYRAGNATEHTYRPDLKALLEHLLPSITAVNEPKRVACGAPDYAITRAEPSGPRTVGWVEAKDIGVSLDETERSDQLKNRYIPNLPNLILTDYLEFRWYVDGKPRMRVRLATVGAGRKLTWDADGARRVGEMLTAMLGQKAPDITSPDDLARRMAALAHMIRNVALDTLRSKAAEVRTAHDALDGLWKEFKKTLIPDLTDEAFVDMFAQTLAYGLFAARYNHTGSRQFEWQDAARDIPHSNPFLRRLFAIISGPDLVDAPYIGFVDDLARLLAGADMAAILRDFGKRTRTEDPILHFYEPFLQAYDSRLRELRGVYYTPDPVVSYITRSVDALLKRDFAVSDGLAGERVMLLDPACGTGTFLSNVINLIRERFQTANNAGAWPGYVRERLLPRVFGFELLMAPYAMAHLRLGMQLAGLDLPEGERTRWGVRTAENERLGVYLTNTLEAAAVRSELLIGKFISDEANAAARVKRDAPVMVVLGNPPYSGNSANTGKWITSLLRGEDLTNTQGENLRDRGKGDKTDNYFEVDGKSLGERNPKWLNDDYVKFIRFAQWRIERTGHGVLAFVTNHGYLDNPTFKGMRQSLMRTFDEIYLLDLHGNSKKKERAPDGGKDENVFDIQQGVAIGLFVRRRGAITGPRNATVRHAHLYGERLFKYDWLTEHNVENTEWQKVEPQSPMYLFISQNTDLLPEYQKSWRIPDVFPINASTVTTARNDFSMAYDSTTLVARVKDLQDARISDEDIKARYDLQDVSYWTVNSARKELYDLTDIRASVRPYAYRPFDNRFVIYHAALCERLRFDVMRHMMAPNMAFLTHRPQSPNEFTFAFCTRLIGDQCVAANKTVGGGNSFEYPLYLYPDPSKPLQPDLPSQSEMFAQPKSPTKTPGGRRPNLSPEFIADFSARLGLAWVPDGKGDRQRTFGPEDVFSYIYAILHSPTYRERYADFLKSDFPRVPLTRDADLFRALCALGDRLVGDHLLERALAATVSYPVAGDSRVEAVRYLEPDPAQSRKGRVYINKEQYFDGVEPDVWEFHIGGYQVAEKWLKDRKGRALTYDDIEHYGKTLAALADTASLMEQIDEEIEAHGGWPLDAPAEG